MITLTDLLSEAGVRYWRAGESRHVSTGWVGVDCPRCSPGGGKGKLGINARGLWCSCWSCGPVRLGDVLTELTGWPWPRVKAALAALGAGDGPPVAARPRGRLVLPLGLGDLLSVHRRYLAGRGFDPDHLAAFWGVRGVGMAARLAWRVWIPIAHRGRTVSWTTRAASDDPAVTRRYHAAAPAEEELPAKSLLFGMDHVRHAVVVCEGPFDAMRVGPGAVATGGVGVTAAQFAALTRFPVRAVVFDSEPGAQRRAARLCADLAAYPGKTVRVELDAPDPGSAGKKEVQRLRREFLD